MANNPTSEKYEQLKPEMEQTEQKKKRLKANNPTLEDNEHLKLEMEEIEPEHERLKCSIEQLKQELLERHIEQKEELIALQEESKRLDEQIKKKDEQNKQNDQELQHYVLNTSIEGIWENDDNTNFVLYKYGGSLVKSQVDPKGLPASAVEVEFPLVAPILDSKILRKASSLLAAFEEVDEHGCRVQSYGNEADVRGSVHSALRDALKILNGLHGC